jgi:hypothetical protein
MKRIGLITTGECEHRALPASLRSAFSAVNVEFEASLLPVPSITSNYLSYPGPATGGTKVDKLVASILSTLERRDAPDFVFTIDDLELPNVETPDHVTRLVSDAFRRALGTPTHRELERLGARCSFHLLCPMLETYFFGEPAALVRAGSTRSPILDPSRHLEDFRSDDEQFLAYPDVPGHRAHPWRRPDRHRHPKRYLCFLVDPADEMRTVYKESIGGCRALASLDWAQVFRYAPPGIAFAHALFEDLADALDVPNPFPGTSHPLTRPKPGGLLRNLA